MESACPYNLIERLPDNDLTEQELDQLDQHLAGCADCRQRVAGRIQLSPQLASFVLFGDAPPASHIDDDQFADYFDGTLDADQMAILESHVWACDDCRKEFDSFKQMRGISDAVTPPAIVTVPPPSEPPDKRITIVPPAPSMPVATVPITAERDAPAPPQSQPAFTPTSRWGNLSRNVGIFAMAACVGLLFLLIPALQQKEENRRLLADVQNLKRGNQEQNKQLADAQSERQTLIKQNQTLTQSNQDLQKANTQNQEKNTQLLAQNRELQQTLQQGGRPTPVTSQPADRDLPRRFNQELAKLAALVAQGAPTAGGSSANPPSKNPVSLIYPVGKVVLTRRPKLRFQMLDDAKLYHIEVYETVNYVTITEKRDLKKNEWQVAKNLTPGMTYGWSVTALDAKEEAIGFGPQPTEPLALFQVGDAKLVSEVRRQGDNLIQLATTLARVGETEEARTCLQMVVDAGGKPSVIAAAQKMLRSLNQRFPLTKPPTSASDERGRAGSTPRPPAAVPPD